MKCEVDFIRSKLTSSSYIEMYENMESFIQKVYPDECNHDRIGHDLCMLGTNYINKGDYVSAVKLLKAGAILCNDG